MRLTGTPSTTGGFSLIELIMVMAIFAILSVFGAPSLFAYLENSRIRTAAQSFYASAQTARTEAIQRNSPAQLILTSVAPTEANVNTTTLTSAGPNWIVRVATTDPAVFAFVEGGSLNNTSTRSDGTSAVTLAATAGGVGVSTITFNAMSNTTLTQTATVAFANPGGGACATAGPMTCLNVQISPGGRVQLCDPTVTTLGDTRRCPT